MTKPLSSDLRLRAVEAVAAGMSCRAVADRFRLAPSTVVKWMGLWRETGSCAPRHVLGGALNPEFHPAKGQERPTLN